MIHFLLLLSSVSAPIFLSVPTHNYTALKLGDTLHLHSRLAHRVFLVARRDHSADVISRSTSGKVLTFYDDSGVVVSMDDGVCSQCALSIVDDSHDVAVCAETVSLYYAAHTDDAEDTIHAARIR